MQIIWLITTTPTLVLSTEATKENQGRIQGGALGAEAPPPPPPPPPPLHI